MASSVTIEGVLDYGGDARHYRQGTLSVGVYATGGVAVTREQLGFSDTPRGGVDDLDVSPSAGYVPEWDKATGKVKVFHGDNNNASDGPLVEVPNSTDLSAVSFRFRARGE